MIIITTKRRLELAITQLWEKIKATFALIGHTHPISDTVSSIGSNPVKSSGIYSFVMEKIRQAIQPSEKEVVSVLSYNDDYPSSAEEGDLFIDSSNNILYTYKKFKGEYYWDGVTPSEEVLYITMDTHHIYIYDGEEFQDVTGTYVDDTIYITTLAKASTELNNYTTPGIYKVCYTKVTGTGIRQLTEIIYYTMTVTIKPSFKHGNYIEQVIANKNGYQSREYGYGMVSHVDEWSDWTTCTYASQEDVDDMYDELWKYVKKNRKLAQAAL